MMSKIFNYLPPNNRADKIVTVPYPPPWVDKAINKREPTLQANSKLGLCYTPCILTLMYG